MESLVLHSAQYIRTLAPWRSCLIITTWHVVLCLPQWCRQNLALLPFGSSSVKLTRKVPVSALRSHSSRYDRYFSETGFGPKRDQGSCSRLVARRYAARLLPGWSRAARPVAWCRVRRVGVVVAGSARGRCGANDAARRLTHVTHRHIAPSTIFGLRSSVLYSPSVDDRRRSCIVHRSFTADSTLGQPTYKSAAERPILNRRIGRACSVESQRTRRWNRHANANANANYVWHRNFHRPKRLTPKLPSSARQGPGDTALFTRWLRCAVWTAIMMGSFPRRKSLLAAIATGTTKLDRGNGSYALSVFCCRF